MIKTANELCEDTRMLSRHNACLAEIDELRAALAERDAEIERLKLSATYAEHIDATPENRLQTMLHDTLTERDALRKVLEQALVELIECRSVDDNERGRLAAITAIQEVLHAN